MKRFLLILLTIMSFGNAEASDAIRDFKVETPTGSHIITSNDNILLTFTTDNNIFLNKVNLI